MNTPNVQIFFKLFKKFEIEIQYMLQLAQKFQFNHMSHICFLSLIYTFLSSNQESDLKESIENNQNLLEKILEYTKHIVLYKNFNYDIFVSEIVCYLSGFTKSFFQKFLQQLLDNDFFQSLYVLFQQKDYYIKANVLEFLINISFDKKIIILLFQNKNLLEVIFYQLKENDYCQDYQFRLFQFIDKITQNCFLSVVSNFFANEVQIIDVIIKQIQYTHCDQNLIILAQILENLFTLGESIKGKSNDKNIFLERVFVKPEYPRILEQVLSHENYEVYNTFKQLIQNYFQYEYMDNQLQMLKDTNYLQKKHIFMVDSYSRDQINEGNKYVDILGAEHESQAKYDQYKQVYCKRLRNNARKNLKNQITYVDSNKDLFKFNSSYAIKDMVCGHFQIPQNLKRLTDKQFLYMGDNSLNVINISSGVHKQILQIPTSESLNTSSQFLMASGVIDSYKIFLYDLKSQKYLLNRKIHSNQIANYTKFIEEQQELIVTWNSPEIGIIDLNTLKIKKILKVREGVNHLDYNIKQQLLVTAQDNEIIQICDIRGKKECVDFVGHLQNNFATAFLNDFYFATGGEDVTTRIWDLRKPQEQVHILQGEHYQIGDLIYDSKKNYLYALETKMYFYCYDLNCVVPQRQLQEVPTIFQGFSLNENKNKLYVGSFHNPIRQYIQEFDIN